MDEANGDGDVPAWTDLFERGAAYGIDEEAVREALAGRRGRTDD
jgi:hypothetical protein